jgi:hypothetical protein
VADAWQWWCAMRGRKVRGATISLDVTPLEIESDALLGLRRLGFTAAEARTALARTAHLPATTLEQRLRVALVELQRAHAHCCAEAPARWQPGRRRAIALTAPTARDPGPDLG